MNPKICAHCGIEKPPVEFYRRGRTSLSSWCKECVKERSHRQTVENRAQGIRRIKAEVDRLRRHPLTPIERISYDLWNNARKRDMKYARFATASLEYVESLVKEFCGNHYYQVGNGRQPFQPSLDRIDNNRGYELGNIKVIWLIENYARNTFTEEALIEFCKRKLGLL